MAVYFTLLLLNIDRMFYLEKAESIRNFNTAASEHALASDKQMDINR